MSFVPADYSRIRDTFIKDTFIVGLGYLEGFVFVRSLAHEITPVFYRPTLEITAPTNLLGIAPSTFIPEQKFGKFSLNATNVLDVTDDFHLYQIFAGIAPSTTRFFFRTDGTEQKELDVGNWGTNRDYRFGYLDGFISPLLAPSIDSEFFIPPHILYEFGVFDPNNFSISPTFYFTINRMLIGIVKNPDLIARIISGAAPARLIQIGGLKPPKYNQKIKWGVDPIRLDATFDTIRGALGV